MIDYDNPILSILEALENNSIDEIKRIEKGATNNNAFHTGYTDREYSNPNRFLTDLRRERLANKSKFKSFPVEMFIEFISPKTADRVQILIEYPSLDTNAKILVTTYSARLIHNRNVSRGYKIENPVNDSVKYDEKRVTMEASIEKTQEIVKQSVKKLISSGFEVLTGPEQYDDIIANIQERLLV